MLRSTAVRMGLAVVASMLVLLPPAPILAAEVDCAGAGSLVTNGALDEAETRFRLLLEEDPSDACAQQGLGDVAGAWVARGAALAASSLNGPASEAYARALAVEPGNDAAAAGLAAIAAGASPEPTAAKDVFATARALRAAGFETEAREALGKAVEANPASTVPPDLDPVIPAPAREFGAGLAQVGPFIQNIGVAFGGAALVAVAVLLLIGYGWNAWRSTVRLGEFLNQAKEPKPDVQVASMIGAEFGVLRAEGGGPGLQFMSGPDQAVPALKDVAAIAPQLGGLAAIAALVPRRVSTVRGGLLPTGSRGAGIMVELTHRTGRTTASTSLWERQLLDAHPASAGDDEPAPDTDGATAKEGDDAPEAQLSGDTRRYLALAAASWAMFHLPWGRDGARQRQRILRTSDDMSYVHFRVGALAQELKQFTRARSSYTRALDKDPGNVGALFNIAILNVLEGEGENPQQAAVHSRSLDRLREALALLDQLEVDRYDRLWYRVRYNIAATHLHLSVLKDAYEVKQNHARCAREAALKLVVATAESIQEVEKPKKPAGLVTFLKVVEGAAVAVLADAVVRIDPVTQNARPKHPAAEAKRRQQLIDQLTTAREGIPADWLISYLGDPASLAPRVRYNLACYWSGRREFDAALTELRYGVEGGGAVEWAKLDPSLADLRVDRKEEFAAILRTAIDPNQPEPPRPTIEEMIRRGFHARLVKLRLRNAGG